MSLAKADVGACRQWSIHQPNCTGVEHKEPCDRRGGGGGRRIRFLKWGKSQDYLYKLNLEVSETSFQTFLPWALRPALKRARTSGRCVLAKLVPSIIQVSEHFTKNQWHGEKQRCNVWALSNVGGAVSILVRSSNRLQNNISSEVLLRKSDICQKGRV